MIANNPVLAGITALVTAGVGLLAAFGVDFTAEQTAAVVAFVAATYAVAVLVRSQVTPTRKLRRKSDYRD
ncbi:MAG: hypothetical protein H0U19_15065 [Acidobacteria bacterium]|nr:hypothetical protein [Acidobacteriota bacterium]